MVVVTSSSCQSAIFGKNLQKFSQLGRNDFTQLCTAAALARAETFGVLLLGSHSILCRSFPTRRPSPPLSIVSIYPAAKKLIRLFLFVVSYFGRHSISPNGR